MSTALPASATALASPSARLRLWLPGMALAAVIAMAATLVSTLHGGPQLLYALFFGVAFHYLSQEPRTRPGIEFCSRTLLRLAVGLLGARITLTQIESLGWTTAAVVVTAVASTLILGVLLGRALGMKTARGVLSGGAVGICGASAALAIAAVLPRDKESDRFTLMVVVTVTVMSTLAMIVYPLIARGLHLSPHAAGLFLGGTIHDVAQVVGAGYMLGNATGDVATIVKLFRVTLLIVVVIAAAAYFRRERAQTKADSAGQEPLSSIWGRLSSVVPWFLWVFLALVFVNSEGWLPPSVQETVSGLSRACLVMAIAALGTKTSFAELARTGWRPLVLILCETLWIAALVLGYVLMTQAG